MSSCYYPEFSVDLPQGWADDTVPTFIGRRQNGFQSNIVIAKAMQGERLGVERHAQKQLELIATILKDYIIHEQEAITFQKRRAYRVIHSFDSAEGKNVKQLQLYIDMDDKVMTITCSAAAAAFEQQLDDFNYFLDGFELS